MSKIVGEESWHPFIFIPASWVMFDTFIALILIKFILDAEWAGIFRLRLEMHSYFY